MVFDEVASWYGPTSVTAIVFETSWSGADSESEEEEMLTIIMNGEPAESLSALQLTGRELSSSNQSLARHEETFDVVSPWCYTRRKKKKGKMPDKEAKCRIQVYNGRIHTVPLDNPSSGHLCK